MTSPATNGYRMGMTGRLKAGITLFSTLFVIAFLSVAGSRPAVAQARITMMPPQATSPAPDIYMWGDRLIISFRLAGDPSGYMVGVAFGSDTTGRLRRPGGDENVVTYELQLDQNDASEALSRFRDGAPYVYARALVQRGGEDVAEKGFWVMNPARRWPDGLRLLDAPDKRKTGEIRVAVNLPQDRLPGDYFLDLVQLPMRLLGGTVTTPVAKGKPIPISEDQANYTVPVDGGDGVYEIRLRGPGDYVHSIRRFQYAEPLPAVKFTDLGPETEDLGGDLSMTFYKGKVEVTGFPADKDARLVVRTVGNNQVTGGDPSVGAENPASNGKWQGVVQVNEPTTIELTTSYLDDEIVLGRYTLGSPDNAGPQPIDVWSSRDRVMAPVATFDLEVAKFRFGDADSVWAILRENYSGRRPMNAPAGFADTVIKRYKVTTDHPRLALQAPDAAGEYRVDLEPADPKDGGPNGLVADTHVFSVVGGEGDAHIDMEKDKVIMGGSANMTVSLEERSFAAPVTIEAVRPAGVSSTGLKYASRIPPMPFQSPYERVLWDYASSDSLYPDTAHFISWRTWLWAPGRYEARVILGLDSTEKTQVLARKFFDVIVPPAPGAIVSVAEDEENTNYLQVSLQLPEWAKPDASGAPVWPYGLHVAIARPRARTLGNALRFEKVLEVKDSEKYDYDRDGRASIRVDRPYGQGDFQAWLLLDVYCFAKNCPTAILDRKAFTLSDKDTKPEPKPDHIRDRLIFPEDDSINRPGRQFPDIHAEDDGG